MTIPEAPPAREAAHSALREAWNHAGESPEGKPDPASYALTMALAGIGYALLDLADGKPSP